MERRTVKKKRENAGLKNVIRFMLTISVQMTGQAEYTGSGGLLLGWGLEGCQASAV